MTGFPTGPLSIAEIIKILSVLENPPEAAAIREALITYQVPEKLQFKWGENRELVTVLQHLENPQDAWELECMLAIVAGKRSLLEIGSSFGGTLKRMASVMPKGALIVSVDFPCDNTPDFLHPLDCLKESCRQIGLHGGNVELFIGDSHDRETVEAVRKYGPFEFCFIDGDHSYEGTKADWENYGPMCGTVAFHDIGGVLGCAQVWKEIKARREYRCEEFISTDRQFGTGIIYRNGQLP